MNYLINTAEFQENNMEYLFFGGELDNTNKNNNISNNNININNVNNDINNDKNYDVDKNINFNINNNIISNINNSSNNSLNQKINTLNFVNNIKSSHNNRTEKNESATIFSKNKNIKKVTLNDFKILKVLGRGTFGKVCLVQYKLTNKKYAMKIMKKNIILEHDQVSHTLLEKNILQNLNYQFLVGMDFCFQTQERIYFVMNFIRGGELFNHLRNCKFFPEETAKFYSAIIGLSLEYLHTHGIAYRDIKPDNILIDDDGYLKLVDFGMAKMLKDKEKAFSLCGTPEYFAPEIITREGHNKNADWWSYGILLYEMLYGISPFYSKNTEKMFELITKSEIKFPKKIEVSENAKDLISKLLIKNQDLRLGSIDGFEDIKKHSFFKGFDFKLLEEKKLEAPYIPTLKGSMDVTNFDSKYTSEEVVTSEISPNTLEFINNNQEQFEDF